MLDANIITCIYIIDCMPLYIRKQCYSRNYILLCNTICKVYTIECTLPRLCVYISYTLHIIVIMVVIIVANCNPCTIPVGQVHGCSSHERMFELTYKQSGHQVGVSSCLIKCAPRQYIVSHGNLNLLYRFAVYNSTGKYICICICLCKCFSI